MKNKRRQYRTAPSSKDIFAVAVVKPLNIRVPGEIVDLSLGGVSVLFEHICDPVYALKEVVHLRLTSPYLKAPLVEPCLVRNRGETKFGRLYGFEFIDWLGLLARLPPELAALFNQRGHYRIEPGVDSPIEVKVQVSSPFGQVLGTVRDLSVTGLSFLAPPESEEALMDIDLILISFKLPNSHEELMFCANILRRDLVQGGIVYGVYFKSDWSEEFKARQNLIAMYVNDRRREALGIPSPTLQEG